MGRRNRYADKELDQLEKLKYENKRLKKQISSLRKQLQRIDIDRHDNLRDLIDKFALEDHEEEIKAQKEKLKKQWECHECGVGFMMIHPVVRQDGTFYYRKCTECSNRTKLKPYTKDVKGIKRNDE